MQQSMSMTTGLPSKRVAPVFGVRGAARSAFTGGKFVVRSLQQRNQNGHKKIYLNGEAQAEPLRPRLTDAALILIDHAMGGNTY